MTIVSMFPLKAGHTGHRHIVKSLRTLEGFGLLTYQSYEPGNGALRTDGVYRVAVGSNVLRLDGKEALSFAQGVLSASPHALTGEGYLRPVFPDAWQTAILWYIAADRESHQTARPYLECTADGGSEPCEPCLTGNYRQTAPAKCHVPIKEIEAKAMPRDPAYRGCNACWRKVMIFRAGRAETIQMVGNFHELLPPAERAALRREHPEVAEMLAGYQHIPLD